MLGYTVEFRAPTSSMTRSAYSYSRTELTEELTLVVGKIEGHDAKWDVLCV
jgi:hypothetical protein